MEYFAVAVDGPSGAGKSTIVKILSQRFGFKYVDTGATFRAVALKVIKSGLDTKKKDDVLSILNDIDIKVEFMDGGQVTYLDKVNVNEQLRTPQVSKGASDVSVIPEVRLKLVEIWRQIASQNNVIMDGRDIGTFVLPHAQLKIYLMASSQERANRRYKEMLAKGYDVSYDDIKKSIEERDYQDSNREFSPAVAAKDAIVIDTTNMTINEVVDSISELIHKTKAK